MTRFTSFVPSTTHFIWLSSFIFKICASSNTMEFAVWTSGVAKDQGAVNIFPWSVFDVQKIRKRKDWSCLEVCRIHKEEKKDPKLNHETTRKQRCKGYETWRKHTIVMFQDSADLEPNLWFLALETCTGYPRTHGRANDLIRKRLLRRHSKSNPTGLSSLLKTKSWKSAFCLAWLYPLNEIHLWKWLKSDQSIKS